MLGSSRLKQSYVYHGSALREASILSGTARLKVQRSSEVGTDSRFLFDTAGDRLCCCPQNVAMRYTAWERIMYMSWTSIVRLFVLFIIAAPLTVTHAQNFCPTPVQTRQTCQYGQCTQTVTTGDCATNILNTASTCADGPPVLCCGAELPNVVLWPCGINSANLPSIQLRAREFGSARIFVPTCARGYRRLSQRDLGDVAL